MKARFGALLCTLSFVFSPAFGIEVTLKPGAFEAGFTGQLDKPGALVDGTVIDKSEDGPVRRFELTLPEHSASEPMTVSLDAGTDGFSNYSVQFEVPFFDEGLVLVPMVVSSNYSDGAADAFLKDAFARTDADDAFGVSQRARVLSRSRRAADLAPQVRDLAIEFLLVRSTAKLISRERVIIDPVVRAAASHLSHEVKIQSPQAKDLFLRFKEITPQTIQVALDALDARNLTVRGRLIVKLDDGISYKSSRMATCPRLTSLKRDFDDEEGDTDAQYSGWNYQRALLSSAFLKCRYNVVLDRRNEVGEFVPNDEASADLVAFDRAVGGFVDAGEGKSNPKWRYEIAKRIFTVAKPIASVLDEQLPEGLQEFLNVTCGPDTLNAPSFSCDVGAKPN